MTDTVSLTDREKQTIREALPTVRRASPEAARLILRLIRASRSSSASAVPTVFASVHEVAVAFGVTDQTVRNWVDRGLMPATRNLGRGPRRIPRSVLASAEALARPRPSSPEFTPQEVADLLARAPRKRAT